MSLNKKKMVREIGRRTRLKNRDVRAVIETLIEVWTEELVASGRIELEGFLAIHGTSRSTRQTAEPIANTKRLAITTGKRLRARINATVE
jgi:nucleoid DNA-binding protein